MNNPILRFLVGALLFSLLSDIVVWIIGLILGWKTSIQFSDGFFWAGFIMILFGFVSFQGYRQRGMAWPQTHLDPGEQSSLWAADTLRGKNLMAFFGIAAFQLFGLSFLVMRLF